MTWQDKNREKYETRLRERWTPDGHRTLICPDGTVVIDATKEQKVRIGVDSWINLAQGALHKWDGKRLVKK